MKKSTHFTEKLKATIMIWQRVGLADYSSSFEWMEGYGAVEEASAVTRWRQSNQNASFRSATNIVAT